MSSTSSFHEPHLNQPPTVQTAGIERDVILPRLLQEMADAWRAGDRPPAERFLDLYPHLWGEPDLAFDLIYEEICLRQECGQEIPRDQVLARFPQWQQQLDILLNCHKLLEADAGPRYPNAGDSLRDFHLIAQLGRGRLGVVFLATQASLADRPVVLKLTPRRGDEHLSLARLQHTHIVPLLSVFDDAGRNLRALCMPYFGGLTLADLLRAFRGRPLAQRTGLLILDALEEARTAAPLSAPACAGSARSFLQHASYIQAIAWLGACVADALKYAHERGLVHLDLKPSNVLLTADGQPMLLDFHLAREPIRQDAPAGALFGGTPAYMSPEQQAALAAAQQGLPVPETVDGRSDLYSLGMVLYEALGGAFPVPTDQAPPSLHQRRSPVPLDLADLVARCLAPNPSDRYADAASLAADLWAHLNDQPLHGVRNRSLAERWRKWRRRRPHALPFMVLSLAVLLVAAAAVTLGLVHFNHRTRQAQTALFDGQQLVLAGRFAEAQGVFHRGLDHLHGLPGNRDLKRELTSRVRLAARAQAALDLHDIADRFRLLYGADFFPAPRLQELESRCRTFWDQRALILDRLGTELDADFERRIQLDLLDLAILGADLRVRLAPESGKPAARSDALQLLAEAESLFGPSAVLAFECRAHAAALGLKDPAAAADPSPAPRSAWEHYALGRALLRSNKLPEASAHLDRALKLEPHGLWPSFYSGVCSYRLNRFQDALVAFTVCTTLAPDVPGCFYNRGLAFVALKRPDRALADFDRALELDPALPEAALNRGIIHVQHHRLPQAAADLHHALDTGADPALTHYNLALLSLEQNDRPAALSHLDQSLQANPHHPQARNLQLKLQPKHAPEKPPANK